MIGVAKSTVTGYEKGNREPDAMKINAIAKALGVTGDYLLATEYVEKEVLSREAMAVAKQYDKLSRDSQEFILMVINHEMQRSKPVETTQPVEGKRKRLSPEQLAERAEQERGIGKTENAPQ